MNKGLIRVTQMVCLTALVIVGMALNWPALVIVAFFFLLAV